MSEKDDGNLASVGRRPTGFESEVRFFFAGRVAYMVDSSQIAAKSAAGGIFYSFG